MPTLQQVQDTCSHLLNYQNDNNWLRCVRNHIHEKHSSSNAVTDWLRNNAREAQEFQQGYGILSYFLPDKWDQVNFFISYALNKADSYHETPHRDRALVYRSIGETIGMIHTQTTLPPLTPQTKSLHDNFSLNGIVVVVDVYRLCLITAFPSIKPDKRQITQ